MVSKLRSLFVLLSFGFWAYACGSDDQGRVNGSGGEGPGGEGGVPTSGGKTQGGGGSAQALAGENGLGGGGRTGAAGEAGGGGISEAGGATTAGGAATAGAAGDLAGGGGASGAPTGCNYGAVASSGTNDDLNLFGSIVYFADGAALPAGHYRVSYVDGCMKYSSTQDWTVHAYADANPYGWFLVGETTADHVAVPPGTVGWMTSNGAFATFDECVTANLALPPVEFDFAGGKLGVWLQDSPYTDNLAGQDNRNPKWQLTLMSECPTPTP